MSRPYIFVSSIYIDLKTVEDSFNNFIRNYGYDAKLFGKGGVPVDYDSFTQVDCVDEVKRSDIYILIIGGRFKNLDFEKENQISQKMKHYNLITKNEYEAAINSKIPTYIFVDKNVSIEFETWCRNKGKIRDFAYVDNKNIFDLIEKIYNLNKSNTINEFSNIDEVSDFLRKKWAKMFKEFLIVRKKSIGRKQQIKKRINCYKLFYYRRSKSYSIPQISELSSLSPSKYRKYEKPNRKYKYGEKCFPYANELDVDMIAMVLEIHKSELLLGKDDDFSYQFYEYYTKYKGKKINSERHNQYSIFPTKVVVFDFDGTLARTNDNLTTWEKLWVASGYSVNDCAHFHDQFKKGKISHKEWCKITLKHFKKGNLTETIVKNESKKIELLDDTVDVIKQLHNNNISLYIISGSIDTVIKEVLGDSRKYFREYKSNKMRFDSNGLINDIIGTKYDFEGKADFIKEVIRHNNVSPYEVLFVGNSANDQFAHLSGARTLCINPHFTDPYDRKEWTHQIRKVESLKQILPFIFVHGYNNCSPSGESQKTENDKPVDVTVHSFDVSFSFPGEHRNYVELIIKELDGVLTPHSYFYDKNYQAQLAQPNLDIILSNIYGNQTKLNVVFVCKEYQEKAWCGWEWRAIREKIFENKYSDIMFIKLDDGQVDGLLKIDGRLNANKLSVKEISQMIIERLNIISQSN